MPFSILVLLQPATCAATHAGPGLPGGYTQACVHLKYLCRTTPGDMWLFIACQEKQMQLALLWQSLHSSRLFVLHVGRTS